MELFYIFKYKFLIFKHRLQQMKLIYKLIIILMMALIIPAVFLGNIIFLKILRVYFEFNSNDYFFVINLIDGGLVLFMLPYLIKKAYSNNFIIEKDYILYTSPISLKTIFFYKFIICTNKFILPVTIITIPNIIAYGIINESSIISIFTWVITLMILMIFISTVIQLLTVISAVTISTKYRAAFINMAASAISITSLVLILAIEKIYGFGQVYTHLKTNIFLKKIFFAYDIWHRLCINVELGKVDIVSLFILIAGCFISIFSYLGLYKLMYIKGEFIKSNTNTSIRLKSEENAFYILLKRLFKDTYILIYKDILLLTRSVEDFGVIIKPIVFTPLPFLGVDNFFSYKTICEILVILFLWLSSDLAVHSVKKEGAMLNQLKNSSFNIVNIIYSKITFTSIISVTIYFFMVIFMCLFSSFTFYQITILGMCIIGIIVTTSTVRVSCAMLFAKEDNESDDRYSISLSFGGEVISYLLMLIASGIVVIISILSLYIASEIGSWISLLLFILLLILNSVFVIMHLRYFTKAVSSKIIG